MTSRRGPRGTALTAATRRRALSRALGWTQETEPPSRARPEALEGSRAVARVRPRVPVLDWREIARKFLPPRAVAALTGPGPVRRPRKRERNVAVMFVDIEGCTRLCETLPLPAMERVIETYFSRYLDMIRAAGGEVTEVLGDGLVALFEGPSLAKDSRRAVLAALRIREATCELNARRRNRHHPITVNIGLEAGRELIGITRLRGASGERWLYRTIGPVTNVAARLCGLARRGQVLVGGRMASCLTGAYRLRALGPRALRNVSAAVDVFEVLPAGLERKTRPATMKGDRALSRPAGSRPRDGRRT